MLTGCSGKKKPWVHTVTPSQKAKGNWQSTKKQNGRRRTETRSHFPESESKLRAAERESWIWPAGRSLLAAEPISDVIQAKLSHSKATRWNTRMCGMCRRCMVGEEVEAVEEVRRRML